MSQPKSHVATYIAEARKNERERCAEVAEKIARESANGEGEVWIAAKIASAIRHQPEPL